MLFRPCIDLHHGVVKQIVGGTLSNDDQNLRTNFVATLDAADYARQYQTDHLTGGHVIQLGSGNEAAALRALAAYPGGLQLGGGVTPCNAEKWLDAGASGVIVTSFLIEDNEISERRLQALQQVVPREKLILDLSCRKVREGEYLVVFNRWQSFTRTVLNADTLARLSDYCGEFLIHAVDVEGKVSGIDQHLVEILAEHSPVPCVYAGGIASYDDIETIRTLGNGKIAYTIGSALDLFGGQLSYRRIVEREIACAAQMS